MTAFKIISNQMCIPITKITMISCHCTCRKFNEITITESDDFSDQNVTGTYWCQGNNPCKNGNYYHNTTKSHKCENKSKKLKIESRNVSFYAIMQFSLFRVVCFLYHLTLKTLSQFERKHIGSSPFFCFVPGIFCFIYCVWGFGVGVLGHRGSKYISLPSNIAWVGCHW